MDVNFDEHITSSILDVSDGRTNSVSFNCFLIQWNPSIVDSLIKGGVILYTYMYTV